MKFKEFISTLDKEIKNVNLLCGEETFYIDKAREKILEKLSADKSEIIIFDGSQKIPVSEIINAIDSAPLFSPQNIVIVKNAPFFGAEGKSERLESILQNMQPTNFVIFTAKSADKRKKLYKIISKVGAVLEADPLRVWQIDEWLNDKLKSIKKNMNVEARKFFSERIGVLPEISLWYLENEFNKISLAVKNSEITAADLKRLLTEPPEVSNFALLDAIDAKKIKAAIGIFRTQTRDKTKIPLLTIMLANHIRKLLRAKFFISQGIKGEALAKNLEMHPFIAKKFSATAETYSIKLLEENFILVSDADYKLKFGLAGAEILEKIIIKLCKR
ncbi:MAG: DNA polymerase III subunit delta [Selenomonadaceae bacterium]|nr:DNA polymerase III subunit delta [Selenomonadaceae bacterium]